jgi:Domain of Unknown Function (DUF1080)
MVMEFCGLLKQPTCRAKRGRGERFSAVLLCIITLFAGCDEAKTLPKPTEPAADMAPVSTAKPPRNDQPSPVFPLADPIDESFEPEEGYTTLSLDDFTTFPPSTLAWQATADGFASTGKPKAYLYSKQAFANCEIRFELKYPELAEGTSEAEFKGNTGLLVFIQEPHAIWPPSIEVQGKHVDMAAIKANGGVSQPATIDSADQRAIVRKPPGQWNQFLVILVNGAIVSQLNGIEIASSVSQPLTTGRIGFQAEGHPYLIRHLRVKEIASGGEKVGQ